MTAWVRPGLACQNPCVHHALHFVAEQYVVMEIRSLFSFVKFESEIFQI